MPIDGNAATGGKQRNSKSQSTLRRTVTIPGGGSQLVGKHLRLLGMPNLSLVLDNTAGANAVTATVEVTVDNITWVKLPVVTAGVGLSAYATWVLGAREARITLAGTPAQTPQFLLSAAA